jgi:hypothetical protein
LPSGKICEGKTIAKKNNYWLLPYSAYLGISALAENLTSLSLQDGPQSGIIISLDPTHHIASATPPHSLRNPTPNSLCLLIGIYQQVPVGSSPYLKLKHRQPNRNINLLEMKKTSNGRQPQNILILILIYFRTTYYE